MQSTPSKNVLLEFGNGQPYRDGYQRIFHFFGLRENPFNISPDPRYLSFNPQIQGALDAIAGGIKSGQGLMLLTGEVGTGKTSLTNYLLNWLRQQQIPTSFIFNSRLNVDDLYDFALFDFGISCESANKTIKHSKLISWLFTRFPTRKIPILMIDEAQGLPSAVLEEILLLNLETSQNKLLQIVLVGQPELEAKLAKPELHQLRQRITVEGKIRPLNSAETALYIQRRLRVAGSHDESIFQADALNIVHSYSRGIPRIINILCEHALINAYSEQIRKVTPKIVDEVAQEFQFEKMASLDARPGFDKAISASPRLTPSISKITPTHSSEAEESNPKEHRNTLLSDAPIFALPKKSAVSMALLTHHAERVHATMSRRAAHFHCSMLKSLFSLSSYKWVPRWLDKNRGMLHFPVLHQGAASLIRWLQQPVRPALPRRKPDQGSTPAHLARQIRR